MEQRSSKILKVAIFGTGDWAQRVHIPAFQSCKNTRVIALCGEDPKHNYRIARKFSIPRSCSDYDEILEDSNVDVVSIATSSDRHFSLAHKAIGAGKSVLCEKPIATSFVEAKLLSDMARSHDVKTKVAFAFRYSPSIRWMKHLVETGYIGRPFHFNGFEQNSKYMNKSDTTTSLRADPDRVVPGSLQDYAPHIIDLVLWMFGDFRSVVGKLKNFAQVPDEKPIETNVENGCVWIAELTNGAICTMQSSLVAIGPIPGLEARIYGSRGALIAKIPEESGSREILMGAKPTSVNFRPIKIPGRLQYHNVEISPAQARFALLVQDFANEILSDKEPTANFEDGAKVNEIISAVQKSHLERGWVSLPLK